MQNNVLKPPLLSILTPAVPSRIAKIAILSNELDKQIGSQPVEHLVLLDNKRRSVGLKREALLRAARGDYVAFVDDDDWISPDYIFNVLKALESKPDVVTFLQDVYFNVLKGQVEFRLGNPNEQFKPDGVTKRNAWHVCAWRRSLAIQSYFPDNSYGEDWAYANRLCVIPGLREEHVPKVLHIYRHDTTTTEAPMPG